MAGFRFPRAFRLAESSEFRRLKEKGRAQKGRSLVVSCMERGDDGPARVGLITGRKAGIAVERNRIRRRLREIVRHAHPQLANGMDLVIIARHRAARSSFQELEAEWRDLAARLGILRIVP